MEEKPERPPPSSPKYSVASASVDDLQNDTGDRDQLTSSSREDDADAGRHHRHNQPKIRPRRTIGNYTLVSTLGSGSMGKVKLAVHNITQEKLAVKIVRKQHAKETAKHKDENREVRTIREASIMLLLHHPHIVSLKEMVVLDDFYYMFMEYVGGGQLLDYIISHGKLKERHARRFARQILSALDYCHRNSIVHRDLKIENILISQQGNVKIIDFGLSNLFSPRSHLSTFCGSLYFAAPELLHAKAYTGPEVDVWSFGIVLFVLVCGKVPFDDQNMSALHQKIKRGHVDYPSHLSSDCKNLLSRMLVTNPNHRATISEIMVHPWMNKGYDELVDNHLPDRAPLMLPVDTEVIRNMTGFGFGSEAEIKQQLETIITSEDYQKAAKTLAKRTRDHHHSLNHLHSSLSTSRFMHHSAIPGKKTPPPPNDDPQSIPAAYHPLVSIYYLVKERMERERRAASEKAHDDHQISRSSLGSADDVLRLPDISKPETAHPADTRFEYAPFANAATSGTSGSSTDDTHGLFRRATTGVAVGKRGRTNIRVDDNGNIEADRPNILETGLQKLMNRQFGAPLENSNTDSSHNEEGLHRSNTVFKRLGNAFQRPSADADSPSRRRSHNSTDTDYTGPTPIPSHSEKSNDKTQGHGRKESLGQKVGYFLSRGGSIAAQKTPAATATATTTPPHRRPRQATISGGNPTVEERVMPGKAPAQQLPEFLDVPHSHEQTFPPPAAGAAGGGASTISQGTADQPVKQVFLKGLFSVTTTSTKHPSVIRADLIRVLERLGVKWRESKGRFECQHMPSIDVKQVVGKDSSDDSQQQQQQATTPVTVPDLVVRFEIHIVKVSWLMGMHGLQFRRVSGDPWLYKNMCSRILAELKL